MFDQQFQSVQTKFQQMWQNSLVIAVIYVHHGHKIEFLGAISNFEQFCVYNTNNLRESPCPEKPRKRRIVIDSGYD